MMIVICRMCTYLMSIFVFVGCQFHCEGTHTFIRSSGTTLEELESSSQFLPEQPSISTTRETAYTNMTEEGGYSTRPSSQVSGYQDTLQEISSLIHTVKVTTESIREDVSNIGPCFIHYCSTDTIVNCAGLSLTEVSSKWFPRNTTAIFLEYNVLKLINNYSFSHLNDLRVLNLSNNNIKYIQPNAFSGLDSLKTLNLEKNSLRESSLSPGIFDSLARLTDLRLMYNKFSSNHPEYMLRNLTNLRSLTLDAGGKTFYLKDKLPNLKKLVLSGDVKNFDGKSFENIPNLTEFYGYNLESLSNFTDTALQPLYNLDVFVISEAHIGIIKALRILKPLVGKNMTTISFTGVSLGRHEAFTSLYHNEGILSVEKTQYLIQICVRDFSLIRSDIFVVNKNTFVSPLWKQCLKNLDLSGNSLKGTKLAFFFLMSLKHIEMINLEHAFRGCYEKDSFHDERKLVSEFGISTEMKQSETCDLDALSLKSHASNYDKYTLSQPRLDDPKIQLSEYASLDGESLNGERRQQSRCPYTDKLLTGEPSPGYITIYFSFSLKYLKFSRLLSGSGLSFKMVFVGLGNLVFLDLRDNRLRDFTGELFGLDSLQTLMLSGNDVSLLAGHFFDAMCNLVELDLSNCLLDPQFVANQSTRIFQNLPELKRLDLSSNMLYLLQSSTFAPNKLLEELDLSKNRFRNIPFNLKDTTNLKMLDMRENSLPSLEPEETEELDKLANQHGEFKLFISGNVLSCGCDSLKFLNWLATTRVRLDDDRNFTCINNEGQLSYWSVSDDLEVLWRKCSGEMFLSLAVILLFIMVIGFLTVFVIWKNQTYLMVKIRETFYKLEQKGPEDYQTRVFIGYAGDDYRFPCDVLRVFIEDELRLTTFISDRDTVPSSGVASSIVEAINTSWRTVLVVSERFLCHDEWATFTMRSAVFAISPVNPARLVLLVHEDLRRRLPAEVVSTVPEDNILLVSQWTLDYNLREKLKIRL